MSERFVLPDQVIVNPEAKEVIITPEIEAFMPNGVALFNGADEAFSADPRDYLHKIEETMFSFDSSTGAKIECSLSPGSGSEIFVMWAPFSDGIPQSSSEQIFQYTQHDDTGLLTKVFAKPNSWNQATKAAVTADALKTAGLEMPVLTIYSPLPSVPHNAYTREEYKQIRNGDFSPSARIVEEALSVVQDQIHGPRSESRIDTIHMHGASLGASSAIGSASGIVWNGKKDVKTVTAQELIIAPKSLGDLAARFTVKGTTGEESELRVSEHFPRLGEPLLRRMIDKAGNEPAMFAHMLRGASKVSRLKGLTGGAHNHTPEDIHFLQDRGSSVVIPLAENSGLTHDTPDYLPEAGERIISVRATEGQRIAHLIDEYVGATTLMAVMHVAEASA